MDGDTPVFQDGNPVWVDGEGKEQVMKRDTVSNLRNESKTWRTRAEENLTKLKAFDGLDAQAARDAISKLGQIDQKTLIDAGEVDKVRGTIKAEYETKFGELTKENDGLKSKVNSMILDSAFAGSEYIRDNIAIPSEMFRSHFGQFFKVVEGKVEAFDKAGNRIMSDKSVGEYADFEEAVEKLVGGYSQRDSILKAPEHRGSGNQGAGGNRGTGKTVKRSEFAALPAAKQAELAAKMRAGEIQLVD